VIGPTINVSDDTEVMLKELQERKIKWDNMKKMQPISIDRNRSYLTHRHLYVISTSHRPFGR
jgi:hypothetical protein